VLNLRPIKGQNVPVSEYVEIPIEFNERVLHIGFMVMKDSACQILLGIDGLIQLEADISYRSEVLILKERIINCLSYNYIASKC
jgi:hypothetical protein